MPDIGKKLLLVVLTGIAFGSSIVFARVALRELAPFTITVLRLAIASVAFIITVFVTGKRRSLDSKIVLHMAFVGIISTGLSLVFFYTSLSYLSSGMFTIFLATAPIVTAVLAHVFLKGEKLNKNLLIGLGIALAGVSLLIATKSSGLEGGVFDF